MSSVEKFIAVTKDGIVRNPNETIFPILKQLDNDEWQLIGTGFFISKYGLFLTAKHVLRDVLTDADSQLNPIVAFLFPEEGKYQIRRILKAFLNVRGDVAAGIMANTDESGILIGNPYYGLCRTPLIIGDKIHTYAYPETEHLPSRINLRGDYYEGEVVMCLPEGRDKAMLPNSCYQTTMNIMGGASGAPVFNTEGNVVGINSTSIDCGGGDNISYVSDINEFFSIVLEGVQLPCGYRKRCTVEELSQLGYVVAG